MERLYIPRLRVRKNWYVGLKPDPVDHSHPDVGKAEGAANVFQQAAQAAHTPVAAHQHLADSHGAHTAAHPPVHTLPSPPPPQQHASIRTQPLAQQQQQQQAQGHAPVVSQPPPLPQAAHPQPPQQQAQAQQPATQPAQQQQTQPAQQQTAQPTQQAVQQQQQPSKDMSAVLKVKERIDNYVKQFGQVRWQHSNASCCFQQLAVDTRRA